MKGDSSDARVGSSRIELAAAALEAARLGDIQLFETKIQTERELREKDVRHERELREQASAFEEKARSLQAAEYERRLSVLNHAHDEAKENWARSLPREIFEGWAKANDARIDALEKFAANLMGRFAVVAVVVAFVAAIIGAILTKTFLR